MPANSERLKFSRLRLRNWKNFSAPDAALQDRMFLVGPNASGKSNFLDVFRFLRNLASSGGGLQEAVRLRNGMTAIRCLAARRRTDIEIHVEVRGVDDDARWEYELAFHQDNRRRPLVKKERVRRDAKELVRRTDEEDKKDRERLTQTAVEQVNVNRPFRQVATFFASTQYSHVVPQFVREPDWSVGPSNDPYGGNFLDRIAKTRESI